MRYFAIGDIHGCFDALDTLVRFVNPQPEDTLVMLGDYVDRGPDTCRVIQWLIEQSQQRKIICLKGNHEIMMLRSRYDLAQRRAWALVGGEATWDSYARDLEGEGLMQFHRRTGISWKHVSPGMRRRRMCLCTQHSWVICRWPTNLTTCCTGRNTTPQHRWSPEKS